MQFSLQITFLLLFLAQKSTSSPTPAHVPVPADARWTTGYPYLSGKTKSSFRATVQTSVAGTAYWVVTPGNSVQGTPTAAEIVAGKDGGGFKVLPGFSGSVALQALTSADVTISSTSTSPVYGNTAYDLFLVFKSADGTTDSAGAKIGLTTETSTATFNVRQLAPNSVTFEVTPDAPSTIIYAILSSPVSPSKQWITNKIAGRTPVGNVLFAGSFTATAIGSATSHNVSGLSSMTNYAATIMTSDSALVNLGKVAVPELFVSTYSGTITSYQLSSITGNSMTLAASTTASTDKIHHIIVQRGSNAGFPIEWSQNAGSFAATTASVSVSIPSVGSWDLYLAVESGSSLGYFGPVVGPVAFETLSADTLTSVAAGTSTIDSLSFTYTATNSHPSSAATILYVVAPSTGVDYPTGSSIKTAREAFLASGATSNIILAGSLTLAAGTATGQTLTTATSLNATSSFKTFFTIQDSTGNSYTAVQSVTSSTSDASLSSITISSNTAAGWVQTFTISGTGTILYAVLEASVSAPTCAQMKTERLSHLGGTALSSGYKIIGELHYTSSSSPSNTITSGVDAGSTYTVYGCAMATDRAAVQAASAATASASTNAGTISGVSIASRTDTTLKLKYSVDGPGKFQWALYTASGTPPTTAAALIAVVQTNSPGGDLLAVGSQTLSTSAGLHQLTITLASGWGSSSSLTFVSLLTNAADSDSTASALNSFTVAAYPSDVVMATGYPKLASSASFGTTQISFLVKFSTNTNGAKVKYALYDTDTSLTSAYVCSTLADLATGKVKQATSSTLSGTSEQTVTVTGLTGSTNYNLLVCFSNNAGDKYSDVYPAFAVKTHFVAAATNIDLNNYPASSSVTVSGFTLTTQYQPGATTPGSLLYIVRASYSSLEDPTSGNDVQRAVAKGVTGDVHAVGTQSITAVSTNVASTITGLYPSTTYKVFFACRDDAGQFYSDVNFIQVTTSDNSATTLDLTPSKRTTQVVYNVPGTGYLLYHVSTSQQTPNVAQVVSQISASVTASDPAAGEISISQVNTDQSFTISGLAASTQYYMHLYLTDKSKTTAGSLIVKSFKTIGDLSMNGVSIDSSALSDTAVAFKVNASAACTVYYVVVTQSSSAPLQGSEIEGYSSPAASGSVSITAASTLFTASVSSGLSATTKYDAYFVAKDGSSVYSAVFGPVVFYTSFAAASVSIAAATAVNTITTTSVSLDVQKSGSDAGTGTLVYAVVKTMDPDATVQTGELIKGLITTHGSGNPAGTIYAALGSYSISDNSLASAAVTITGLASQTDYKIYLAVTDSTGTYYTPVKTLTMTTSTAQFSDNTPATDQETATTFRVRFRLTGRARVFYVVKTSTETAPDGAEVKRLYDRQYINSTNPSLGYVDVTSANTDFYRTITRMTSDSTFDIYAVVHNFDGTGAASSVPYTYRNRMKMATSALSITNWQISSVSTTDITFAVQLNAEGTVYLNVLARDAVHDLPSASSSACDNFASYSGTGAVASLSQAVATADVNAQVTVTSTGTLTEGTLYDVYICALNSASTFWAGAPAKKQFTTLTTESIPSGYPDASELKTHDNVSTMKFQYKVTAGTHLGVLHYFVALEDHVASLTLSSYTDFFTAFNSGHYKIHAKGTDSYAATGTPSTVLHEVTLANPVTAARNYKIVTLLESNVGGYQVAPQASSVIQSAPQVSGIFGPGDSSGSYVPTYSMDNALAGGGPRITITGTGFQSVTYSVTLGPGNTVCTYVSSSNTQIVCDVGTPSSASALGTGDLIISTTALNTDDSAEVKISKYWTYNGGSVHQDFDKSISPRAGPEAGGTQVIIQSEHGEAIGSGTRT